MRDLQAMRKDQPAPAIWDAFQACCFKNLFEPWWTWSGLTDLKHFSLDGIQLSSAGWKGAMAATLERLSTTPPDASAGEVHHRTVPSLLEKKELGRGPYSSGGGGRCPNVAGGAELLFTAPAGE